MDCKVVLLHGVEDVDSLAAFGFDVSCVTYLATHFSIERSAVEHELIHHLVLLLYRTLLDEADAVDIGIVITEEFLFLTIMVLDPVAEFIGSSLTGSVLLLLEFSVKLFKVNRIAFLRSDKFGKVDRESVCVVKHECVFS